jgi:hypothetical protein
MLAGSALSASAETLMMPDRQARTGVSVVVWGASTLTAPTCTIDFGDSSSAAAAGDRSYLTASHVYASGTFTATLSCTAGAVTETDTAVLTVAGPAPGTEASRNLGINMAIQDGLRFLWQAQDNRAANFPSSATTTWGATNPFSSSSHSWTALVTLAFENQGYILPNSAAAPTGIYEKYVVQRGLNYVVDQLRTLAITPALVATNSPQGDPCVGPGIATAPNTCTALQATIEGNEGYATAVASLPLAGSQALNRVFAAGLGSQNGNFVAGKTYRDVLQRLIDAIAYGQNDTSFGNAARGGWIYNFNSSQTDGSTVGWDLLSLLDANAAGIVEPAFVKTEFTNFSFVGALNNDGSFDYRGDGSAAANNSTNLQKAGIGITAMFYTGDSSKLGLAETYISNRWAAAGDAFACTNGTYNKGCSYGMFNVFKGLKLFNVQTLPGVGRPAGPGAIPANDWYADYQDYLVNNQSSPTSITGGNWGTMVFSCCASDHPTANAAIAELILAPVALVLPDPGLFSTVGLSPQTDTNPVGTDHTVTATATASGGAPVPGVTINFNVLTGPNAGKTGSGQTNVNGQTTFTYHDDGGAGTDTIQASIGTGQSALLSNIVTKIWANDCSQIPGVTPVANLMTPMFPLDHGFRNVTIGGVGTYSITQICQDENPNFEGVPAYAVDGSGVGTDTAGVRAERSGTRAAPGNGRVYHIFYQTSPGNNIQCSGQVTVGVPITDGGTAVDNGATFNSITGGACAIPQ